MLKTLFDNIRAGILAILVHVVLIAMLVFSLDWTPKDEGDTQPPQPVVKAVVVDAAKVDKEIKQLRDNEKKKQQAELNRQKRLDEQAKKATRNRQLEEKRLAQARKKLADRIARSEAETERLAKLKTQQQEALKKKQQAELERQKLLQEQKNAEKAKLKAAEEKKQLELASQKIEQQRQQMEAENKRLQEEQKEALIAKERLEKEQKEALIRKQRLEEERQKALLEKQKLEDERKKLAEQKRKAEIAKQKAEEEQRQAEAAKRKAILEKQQKQAELALQDDLAEEARLMDIQRKTRMARYYNEYKAQIQSKVRRNWSRPIGAPKGLSCKVLVTQIPGGDVTRVRVTASSGNVAFDSSVEKAVLKSSPLPRPRDSSLFEREIEFIFDPEN